MHNPIQLRLHVFSQFGKGVFGALGLSFAESATGDCDKRCRYHPGNKSRDDRVIKCYALTTESYRLALRRKLKRHRKLGAARTVGAAIVELRLLLRAGLIPRWLRISVNGPVPTVKKARANKPFQDNLRLLFEICKENGIPVHFPVESPAKTRFYRQLCDGLCVVRESTQNRRRFLTAIGAVSFGAGNRTDSPVERIGKGLELCRARKQKTDRDCFICPAQLADVRKRENSSRAKCGACKLCARADVDIVYLNHR